MTMTMQGTESIASCLSGQRIIFSTQHSPQHSRLTTTSVPAKHPDPCCLYILKAEKDSIGPQTIKAEGWGIREIPQLSLLAAFVSFPTSSSWNKRSHKIAGSWSSRFQYRPRKYTDRIVKLLEDEATTGENFCYHDANERQSESSASI